MRCLLTRASIAGILAGIFGILTLPVSVPAAAAGPNSGAVEQTIPPPVAQNPKPPPLKLSDDQRAKIRQAVSGENTEVQFSLKSNKPSEKFEPSVGAKIPAGLKPHTLPPPALADMPVLKEYKYLKFKQQVLIIDPMSRKIVDMFPET
jgi:hypothetical protein